MKYRIPLIILFLHLIVIAAFARFVEGGSEDFVGNYAALSILALGADVIAVILIAMISKKPAPYLAGIGLAVAVLLVIIFFATSQSEFSR